MAIPTIAPLGRGYSSQVFDISRIFGSEFMHMGRQWDDKAIIVQMNIDLIIDKEFQLGPSYAAFIVPPCTPIAILTIAPLSRGYSSQVPACAPMAIPTIAPLGRGYSSQVFDISRIFGSEFMHMGR